MPTPTWLPLLAESGGGGSDFLWIFGGMLLIFYFVMWRPQAKERRLRDSMLGALKSGDRVVTTAGLYGTVTSVKPDEVILKVDDKNNVRLTFTRAAIQSVIDPNAKKAKVEGDKAPKSKDDDASKKS